MPLSVADKAERIYRLVALIPSGSVATYGQLAKMDGIATARQVGSFLASTPQHVSIPWHRVLNAQGRSSLMADKAELQWQRLRAEGVFSHNGKIRLRDYQWQGPIADEENDLPGFG